MAVMVALCERTCERLHKVAVLNANSEYAARKRRWKRFCQS